MCSVAVPFFHPPFARCPAHHLVCSVDANSGRTRGFAFVIMETPEEAKAAMEATNGIDLDGRTVSLSQEHCSPVELQSRSTGGPLAGSFLANEWI